MVENTRPVLTKTNYLKQRIFLTQKKSLETMKTNKNVCGKWFSVIEKI